VIKAAQLNADGEFAGLNKQAVQETLRAQGESWYQLITERCPYLYAYMPVYISPGQLQMMQEVIAAAERVTALPGWDAGSPQHALGVFYGYDFHLNEQGAHLIEINTNAGGAYLNALLLESQRDTDFPGDALAVADLEQAFLDMFRNEWRLAAGDVPLRTVAIVDDLPEEQYLYPEFLLAQAQFERAGITAHIVDPSAFSRGADGVYCNGQRIDLIYNRLTDFELILNPLLLQAYLDGSVVVTPNPAHYSRYADKRNLARLSDAPALHALGATDADIAALQSGLPETQQVDEADRERWWDDRKQWFFKPATGYGGRGSYRGANITRRVFEEIMQGGYVAQKMAVPGERILCVDGAEPAAFKSDVRCYVYDKNIQLVAARLYQGQTTNFRTPGGGFALVRVVG